tara:strand:- start:150 stop:815 length:666 start_codon:yes stop_codon:yes gene_type:complete
MKNNFILVAIAGFLSVVAITMEQLAYQSEKTLVKLDEEKIEWTYKKEYFLQLNEHLDDLSKYMAEIEFYLRSYNLEEAEKTNLHERTKLKLYNIFKDLPNNSTFNEIKPAGFNNFLRRLQFSESDFTELYSSEKSIFHISGILYSDIDSDIYEQIVESSYDAWYDALSQIPKINKKQNKIRSLRQVWLILSMSANILSLIALFLFFKKILNKEDGSAQTTA